ncbi:hypothetical protein [Vulcanisaeta sp. EB80]|uniref:hypothetical protein n=1 Tax=Vulcanisaeta sp. EB80 TaxID=1650660 RepID=UPI001180C91C|nr:hypothetical protein [Vulcanisaeta sp. EB80]
MVQRDRRPLVFKILTVILLLVFLVDIACLGQPIARAPGPSIQQTIVLNLLYGQQYFGVPHVYMGYISNTSRPSKWPIYYGPSNASLYWAEGNLSSDQPVLELVSIGSWYPGVMFWNGYFNGGNITVSMIGTYSSGGMPLANGSSYPIGGFVIYLFLNPTTWNISPQYNYTIINDSTIAPESPVMDAILLPQSSTPYLVIQWEPFWQIFGTAPGATGQWNVWIVNNTKGNNPSVSPSPSSNLGYSIITRPHVGWDGIGTGAFQPKPGDLIDITVTYDPSTNTLTGVATDLNTTQSANFTLNLNGYYTPPSSGNYVFGVGAGVIGMFVFGASYNYTGIYPISFDSFNNWALLYTAVSLQLAPPPIPPTVSSLAVQVFSAPNRLATSVPGIVYGVLYNSSGFSEVAYMNSSGYLNFYGLSPGTYTLEVYHYPNTGFNFTEYWGSETINIQPGYNTATFIRNEPVIYNVQPIVSNGQITINITVNNPLSGTVNAMINLWVVTNPSEANPNVPTISEAVTLSPGLNTIVFHYTPNQTGTYYVYAELLAMYETQYVATDQWGWASVSVQQQYQLILEISNTLNQPVSVTINVYESNTQFSQGNPVSFPETITIQPGGVSIASFNLTPGIYEYNLTLNYPMTSLAVIPSAYGFIALNQSEVVQLTLTNTYVGMRLLPVNLPGSLGWYVIFDNIIIPASSNGYVPIYLGGWFGVVNLPVVSMNPNYVPLFSTIQINATSAALYYNGSTIYYAIPFMENSETNYVVRYNGVVWSPLYNEYSQPNFDYEWEGGFSYGMASTAILYYLGEVPLPSPTATTTNQLYLGPITSNTHALQYLTDASLAVVIHQFFGLGNSTEQEPADVAASTAVNYINDNTPVILTVDFPWGYYSVVAWGYIEKPDGSIIFLTYDPNYPQIITYAIYNPTNQSFMYFGGSGNVGYVINVVEPQPVGLSQFAPSLMSTLTNLKNVQVYLSLGLLLNYRLYVSTLPINVYYEANTSQPLTPIGNFTNMYFVSNAAPGLVAGYEDGGSSSPTFIVAVQMNASNIWIDPNGTLEAFWISNHTGKPAFDGLVINSTKPVFVKFANKTDIVIASMSNTTAKIVLFTVTNKTTKTFNATLTLMNGKGYMINANYTDPPKTSITSINVTLNLAPQPTTNAVVITEPTGSSSSSVPIWAVVVDAVAIVIIAISTTILIMSRRRQGISY